MKDNKGLWDAEEEFDVPDASDNSASNDIGQFKSRSPLVQAAAQGSDSKKVLTCSSGTYPLRHERWTAGRVVSALRWLRAAPNIVVASYAQSESSRSEQLSEVNADGVVAAWDAEAGDLQRALLHTASLTSLVAPHPLSPSLIIAGTEYGELVMWDTRTRLPTPVMHSETGSVAPVRAVEAADASSPFVVSASADGSVSVWALSNMAKPMETTVTRERGLRDIRPSAMAIPVSAAFQHTPGTSSLGKRAAVMLGCEDGGVYRVDNAEQQWTARHAGARANGPLTALDCHPGHLRYPQLGDLAITSCFDGSVSMWSFGRRGVGLRVKLFDLGLWEPCSDVQWAPSHPGAFAASDVAGGLSLFDVSKSEGAMCLGRFAAPPPSAAEGSNASRGDARSSCVNRLQWNHDSSTIATGSTSGEICLWRASESLSNPDGSSWEVVSATAKQWRADETSRIGQAEELPVPSSYPFTGLPPVFNPLSAT